MCTKCNDYGIYEDEGRYGHNQFICDCSIGKRVMELDKFYKDMGL